MIHNRGERMHGQRMTLDQAREVLGHHVAFTAHGGQWVTGTLVGIAETPQLIVMRDRGETGFYTLETVDGWSAAHHSVTPLAPCPCGEPNGGPPCTFENPCIYGEGRPEEDWGLFERPSSTTDNQQEAE